RFSRDWSSDVCSSDLRGRFDEVSAIVRSHTPDDDAWRQVRLMVFDLPDHPGPFEARVLRMRELLTAADIPWLQPVPQFRLRDARSEERRVGKERISLS